MTATEARTRLLAQHERLRRQLDVCTDLARRLRAGAPVAAALDGALADLRIALADHNDTETVIIRQLLDPPAAWGSLMIDRMFEEHVGEHAAFWAMLSGTRAEMLERIEDLAEEIDAHMAAEERTFLAPATLRDDVIEARTRTL